MISPSATSPLLTDQGFDNVFRTCGRDDQQGDIRGAFHRRKIFPQENCRHRSG